MFICFNSANKHQRNFHAYISRVSTNFVTAVTHYLHLHITAAIMLINSNVRAISGCRLCHASRQAPCRCTIDTADTVHTILSKSHNSIEIVITGRCAQCCQYKNVLWRCQLSLINFFSVKPAGLPDGRRKMYRKTDLFVRTNVKNVFLLHYAVTFIARTKRYNVISLLLGILTCRLSLYVSEVGSDGLSVVRRDESPKQIRTE